MKTAPLFVFAGFLFQISAAIVFPPNNLVVSNACTLPATLPAPPNSPPTSLSFTIKTDSGLASLAGVQEKNTFLVYSPLVVAANPASNGNVTVMIDASQLSYGANKAYMQFVSGSVGSITYVTIEIDCTPQSTITLNPDSTAVHVAEGSPPGSFVLPSAVNGSQGLSYVTNPIRFSITPDTPSSVSPWLVAGSVPGWPSNFGGVTPGGVADLNVNVNPAGLAVQTQPYTGFLHLRDLNTGYGSADLTVQLSVTSPTTGNATLPHFAVNGVYVTDFYLVNTAGVAANYTLAFFDDSGNPSFIPVQGQGVVNNITGSLQPNGGAFFEAGDPLASGAGGSVHITADASVGVQAVFRLHQQDSSGSHYYEAAVPATAGSHELVFPFDLTTFAPTAEQIYTGIAIANLDSANSSTVTCTARDTSGNTIPNAVTVPAIAPNGHWAGFNFPALLGKRGALDCSGTTVIGAIALHAFATSGAISTLPVVLK